MTNTLLCCDWGTSSFRLRWVDTHTRALLAEVRSHEGIARTFTAWQGGAEPRWAVYKRVLASHINRLAEQVRCSLADVPLVLSGMASASIGMVELPYADLPFAVDGCGATTHRIEQTVDFPHDIVLISGVRSETDVMRGEETQLIGLYQLCQNDPAFSEDATLIMPGTHSKHVTVQDGAVTSFRTYMTGELFALLGQHSILKDSVQSTDDTLPDWDAFRQGVRAGSTDGPPLRFRARKSLLNTLFSVRTNQLFGRHSKEQNHNFLSGMLIGNELSELVDNSQRLVLCSGSHIFDHYQQAADELALSVIVVSTDLMEQSAVAGQLAIFERTNRQAEALTSYL